MVKIFSYLVDSDQRPPQNTKPQMTNKNKYLLNLLPKIKRVLEKTLESPLDCKEIEPVHPEGDQSWVFIGSTDAEAETPILWPLMRRTDSLGKTLMLGKIEDRRRRGQ